MVHCKTFHLKVLEFSRKKTRNQPSENTIFELGEGAKKIKGKKTNKCYFWPLHIHTLLKN